MGVGGGMDKKNFFTIIVERGVEIIIIKLMRIAENDRELWKTERNCGVVLRPARLDHAYYFPRCRNRNRSNSPIKRLHLFYYQRTLLPSITSALGRYRQNRSICRFFGMKKPHVSFLSHGAFHLKKSWLF